MEERKLARVYLVFIIGSVILATLSCCFRLVFTSHISLLSMNILFFLMDITGVRAYGAGFFALWPICLIYILFNALVILANGIAAFSLSPYYPETRFKKSRLFLALFFVAFSVYLISYYLLAGILAWAICLFFILCNWPRAEKTVRIITLCLVTAINLLYLVMLLAVPTVPLNMMP